MKTAGALDRLSDEVCAGLRRAFGEHGFDDRALSEAERIAPGHFDAVRLPLVHWALRALATPAAKLTGLFLYGDTLEAVELAALLGPSTVAALEGAGCLEAVAGRVRARVRIIPFEGLWLLHDNPGAGADAVMGPGPTTLELVRWMPHALEGRAAFDVGCGAGTLALVAALRGARRVLGSDINARAVEVSRFNARLNRLAAEFRVGSLVEPAQGERFDLVVAQPPYVTRPQEEPSVTFLHGGRMGDELALELVSQLPRVLAPRGEAVLLFDSAVRKDDALSHRVRRALGTAALDVVLLSAKGPTADLHSVAYSAVAERDFGEPYAARVRRHRQHLAALDIRQFQHVLLAARGCDVPSGRFTVGMPVRGLSQPAPDAVAALFAALELAGTPEPVLLQKAARPAPGITWVEERTRPDSTLQPRFRAVFPPGSLAADQELSEATYVLLGVLAAAPSVGKAIDAYAEACGAAPGEVRGQVLDFVRQGLATGLLAP